jgi:hypothetical protein
MLDLSMREQPDDLTCGPTCLHAVYHYFGENIKLKQVIREVSKLKQGGTLAVYLGLHALRHGYDAHIYTYNLHLFDPTWFKKGVDIREKLIAQKAVKPKHKLQLATNAYLRFLDAGGKVWSEVLSGGLIKKFLKRGHPILTGLSATYLYDCARETGPVPEYDDIRGQSAGHFVVLCGYESSTRTVRVADPYRPNPINGKNYYWVSLERLVCAILLGVITYDANFLILNPKKSI